MTHHLQTASGKNLRIEFPCSFSLTVRAGLFFLLAVFALMIAAGGCAKKTGTLKKDYSGELGAQTRSTKIYEGLEARLYISATYKNSDFVKAYVDRYAEGYQLEQGIKETMLERGIEASEMYNEFFTAVFTPEDSWNSFVGPGAIWKFYLEDDAGNRLTPVSVTSVDGSDPLIRDFFPYLDPWSHGYILKFPKYTETGTEPIPGAETKSIKLKVTGVLGRGELEWRLK